MEQTLFDLPPINSSLQDSSPLDRLMRRRQNLRLLLYATLLVCDIAAIRCAFIVGANIRGPQWLPWDVGFMILLVHVFVGLRQGAYSLPAVKSRLKSISEALRSFVFATAITCMLIYFMHSGQLVSRLALGISIFLSLLFIAVFRTVFLTIFVGKDSTFTTGVLLVVDGTEAPANYSGDILDAKVVSLVPGIDDPAELSRFAEVIDGYDRIVVSCAKSERRSDWAQMLKCYHVTGEVLLDDGSPLGAIAVDRFGGKDTVVVTRDALSLANRLKKRLMDIVVSSVALFFLLPLFLLVAVAIKLDSEGPVFFAQPRVGRGNRMFRILKFRSMRTDASDFAGKRSAAPGDERITRVGRFIRATSIDELPQLVNVLKGDMSMVGPRPHALGSLAGNKLFWEVDRAYWRRHTLKPGITGLAQVRGFRGATHEQSDLTNRLQADLEYISGWSLWRDVKILISTILVLVHPKAY